MTTDDELRKVARCFSEDPDDLDLFQAQNALDAVLPDHDRQLLQPIRDVLSIVPAPRNGPHADDCWREHAECLAISLEALLPADALAAPVEPPACTWPACLCPHEFCLRPDAPQQETP